MDSDMLACACAREVVLPPAAAAGLKEKIFAKHSEQCLPIINPKEMVHT